MNDINNGKVILIRLPRSLKRALKTKAKERKMSMNTLLIRAVEHRIKEERDAPKPE